MILSRAETDPFLARAGVVIRAHLLTLTVLLAAFSQTDLSGLLATGLLGAVGVAAALLPQRGARGWGVRCAETLIWSGGVVATGTTDSPLLVYLLAPALVAGLAGGFRSGIVVPALASASILLANAALDGGTPFADYGANTAQWIVLTVVSVQIGGWFRVQQAMPQGHDSAQAQEAAHRLLVQLRMVARRLPGSLSPAATAESLLLDLRRQIDIEQGVVLVRSEGQRLVPIALVGHRQLDWNLALSADTAISEAWASQQPVARHGQHSRAHGDPPQGASLAVPFTLGLRTFGVLAVECSRPGAYTRPLVKVTADRARSCALSLDTGLLFEEIRSGAIADERQRMSREIHDGIAQELTYIGYALDNAITESAGRVAATAMQEVREEVGRVVNELRMSLFELRSGVEPLAGLAAALSGHVRLVGARTGLTVHLSLTESTLRLHLATEAELLRIAQEAIANVRKHSGATNLWVTCAVDPPAATLIVEDDGLGLPATVDSSGFGLRIMNERVDRLKGTLSVGQRSDGPGTRVEVRVCGGVPSDEALADLPPAAEAGISPAP